MGNRKRQTAQAIKEAKKSLAFAKAEQLPYLSTKNAFGRRLSSW